MNPPFEITDQILDEHVDMLIDIIEEIPKHQLTILVGQNGTGKSLIRKQLNCRFIKEFNVKRNVVRHISMQIRTESNVNLGAMSTCMHDSPDAPTSIETHHLIEQAMLTRDFNINEPYYLVLDEMEIGMSKESIKGILQVISENIPSWLENTLGILVITHSELVASTLHENFGGAFYDLGYNEVNKDIQKWLNRDIMATDFTWLKEWSNKLFRKIYDRSAPIHEK